MTSFALDTRNYYRKMAVALAAALTLAFVGQMIPATAAAISSYDFGDKVERILSVLARSHPAQEVSVIVQKSSSADNSLETKITANEGTVTKQLPLVDGFSASIPARLVPELALNPNLRSLSLNRPVHMQGMTYDDSTVFSSYVKSTGTTKSAWAAGNYGDGVGVAVLDTGISDMNDFVANGGRLIHGPDLSGENSVVDSYGHGTVMAGIIGGDGYDSAGSLTGAYVGMAPKSWLVGVKVAGRNGVTDVSTVLAGLHWIAAYRDQFNIRVVNISWGTNGTQSYKSDPLDYAVERLWRLGITPVVAAGNGGPGKSTITKPADDPFVITVGAYDDKQNIDPADDSIPSWSSRGPTVADGLAKPDVVAPGRFVIAQRSYGSQIEQDYPKALRAPSYIRGSGTSEAAAVTSGAAALLIRQRPYLTPAQVKYLLMSTAKPISTFTTMDQGAGRIDVAAAMASTNEASANATTPPSSGLGTLEGSRGSYHVQLNCNGTILTIQGEITATCPASAWDGGTWTGGTWTGDAWTGGTWTGGTWTGGTWTGTTWTGGTWTGGTWTGGTWTGGTWTGGTWTGGTWTGGTWTTSNWNGGTWTGGTWTGGTWTGGTWTGGTWTGGTWTGGTWTGGTWTTGTYDNFTSAMYDDFLTAFWGPKPKSNQHVNGEPSELAPKLI